MTIKDFFKKTFHSIALIFIGILSAFGFNFLFSYLKDRKKKNLEKEKEDLKNEIKKTPAADIVAKSDNQTDIQRTISAEQEQFRKRVQDRLNQNLQCQRSNSNASNND